MVDNEITLNDLEKGEIAQIRGFTSEGVPTKFYEMGLVNGVKFEIRQKAPFGGPICLSLSLNNSLLALRRNEAAQILITKK